MEPLSIAGYLTCLICALTVWAQSMKERHELTNYVWSTHD